ncbi:hypothetical protein [Pleionea sediminis]|uniref:hypothetical protein n=1 Tax=Pleionea sediminis TaxID=2569479 RepID=UPI001185D1F8|nr:hypothetical protein [Pleionea sediminis]
MECKYHPDTNASWFCEHCDVAFCNSCLSDKTGMGTPKCILCRRHVHSLGIKDSITPFWYKLGHFFIFPMSTSLFLLAIFSALLFGFLFDPFALVSRYVRSPISTLFFFVPIYFVWTAFLTNMCFSVMEYTSHGNLDSPSFSKLTSLRNGTAFLKLTGVYIFMFLALMKATAFHPVIFFALLLFFIVALPAINMILCMDKSFFSAINPARIARVMSDIGPAYIILFGLLLLFYFSTWYATSFMVENSSIRIGFALSHFVSLYIHFAMYHMFGYVIYQYHHELNYSVHRHTLQSNLQKHGRGNSRQNTSASGSSAQGLVGEAQVFIQEGRYEEAEAALIDAVKQDPFNEQIYEMLYRLYQIQGNNVRYIQLCEKHLKHLYERKSHNLMRMHYLKALEIKPDFVPSEPEIIHYLITSLNRQSDVKPALVLLNALRRNYIEYPGLAEACFTFGKTLTERLGKREDAAKIIRWGLNVAHGELKNSMQSYLNHLV